MAARSMDDMENAAPSASCCSARAMSTYASTNGHTLRLWYAFSCSDL